MQLNFSGFVGILGLHLVILLTTILPTIPGQDNTALCPHQTFKDHGCDCTGRHIRCSGLREFPILTEQNSMVNTIYVQNSHFVTLNRSHTKPWTGLNELYIIDSALSEVTNDALGQLRYTIATLHITGCQLMQFPNMTDLRRLTQVFLQYNNIRVVSYEQVKQCTSLSRVDLKGNKITVLKNGTFRDSCFLSKLNVSSNPLHTIESHFFEGMVIEILDLSYTDIAYFPYFGLRHHLVNLNLDGCKNLKTFPKLRTTYEDHLCTNLTFPFLEKVTFEYHALCCQFQSVRTLVKTRYNESRCQRNDNTKSHFIKNKRAILTPIASMYVSNHHHKRSVSSSGYVCLNLTSGYIIRNYHPNTEETFNINKLCQNISFCFDNRCPLNCNNSSRGDQNDNALSVDIACIEELDPTPITWHTTICWTNGSITSLPSSYFSVSFTSSPTPSLTPSPTPSPTPSLTPTAMIDYSECPVDNFDCWDCIFTGCDTEACKVYQGYCDADGSKKRKRRQTETNLDVTCTSITTILIPISTPCSTNETTALSSYDTLSFMPTHVSSPTPTHLPSSDVSSPLLSTSAPSPSPTPSPTPTVMIDYSECPVDNFDCWDCIFSGCATEACKIYQGYCDADGSRKRKRREVNETVNSLVPTQLCYGAPIVSVSLTCYESITPSSTQMSSQVMPTPTECPNDDCWDCVSNDCNPIESCQQYQYYCDNDNRDESLYCSVVLHIDGYSMISSSSLVLITPNPSLTISSSYSSPSGLFSTAVPGNLTGSPTPFCIPSPALPGEHYTPGPLIECGPTNDPFNPCDDVIDSDVLRAGIWLVILLSIGGNVLVLSVTATYFILRYFKNRKKPHVMYFLYINLALADLFMGIYLLTIAIVDLDTIGEYGLHAIQWQTSAGCRFAGFCAILSSMLSVYTLLIITLERVYTIRFALRHKRFHTHYAIISVIIGWIVTVILAILPMFNVSSYSRVSICLPFETRDVIDKVYVASLLILTGIASFVILVCYCILFYLVACKRKNLIHNSMSGREELKLALRMSLLVVTDFACWAPIAFFGLTAAFQAPLIGVSEAKILMVFIFPINSCLNPILYSFSTRKFQIFFCTLFNRCSPCKKQHFHGFHSSSGPYIPDRKTSQDNSIEQLQGRTRRRSTQISILSHFKSISSFRGSTSSSNQGSRRGSTFSGSSDDGCALQLHTKHYNRPPSPTNGGLRRETTSLSSITSDNSVSSSNTDSGSFGPLINPGKDRKMSLASLSGMLTALPEEKEEDAVSVKSSTHHVGIIATNDSAVDSNGMPLEGRNEVVPFDEICHPKEVTADVSPDVTYFNAFTADEDYKDDIQIGFNEEDGTEYQQQQINFDNIY